jgi:hypothetical protein
MIHENDSTCNRCGVRPPAPGLGWCRACVDAEDARRETLRIEHEERRPKPAATLARYIRHAQRFGTDMVFEAAAGQVWPFRPDLQAGELGALSLRLQELSRRSRLVPVPVVQVLDADGQPTLDEWISLRFGPPRWRLPKAEDGKVEVRGVDHVLFALALVAEGWKRADACSAAQVSRSTLQRELRKSARPPKWAPQAAFPSDADVSNRGSAGDWPSSADLTPQEAPR